VGDQFTCPTDAYAIAEAVYTLVNQPTITGTYHYCSRETISWHQFASLITNTAMQPLKMKTLQKITTDEFPTAAKRPAYSVLDCRKIFEDAGIQHPDIRESIQRVLTQLTKEAP
jgi:dTDP-4-dehydrorhamnose reductase